MQLAGVSLCRLVGRWLEDRTWISGESGRILFWGTIGWLRQHQGLLPGARTLIEYVRESRRASDERLWSKLIQQVSHEQASRLRRLLDVSNESNRSALELLRRGSVHRIGRELASARNRIIEISQVGMCGVDMAVVPARRARELARDRLVQNATALRRRLPPEKQLAALLAAVVYLEAKATDDAVELFDVIMTNELLIRAKRKA
jgi:hypothetical protein